MHKGDIIEGTIEELRFPNKGIFHIEDAGGAAMEVTVKNVLPGQHVTARIAKKRNGRIEANLLEIPAPAPYELPAACRQFGVCGGCQYLNIASDQELQIKENQVRRLLTRSDDDVLPWYEGILESPVTEGYRNKMEFTFGDSVKGGPLTLGMHRRGSIYDVMDADACRIVDGDYRRILRASRDYWAETGVPYYHRVRHEGYLRHLIIRKGMKTGEILVDLVTTTQTQYLGRGTAGVPEECPPEAGPAADVTATSISLGTTRKEKERVLLETYVKALRSLDLDGTICGILHTCNDSIADVVEDQGTEILYGRAFFEEELLGLTFAVTPFSFFQTNSAGAELLYETARTYITQAGIRMGKDRSEGYAAPGPKKEELLGIAGESGIAGGQISVRRPVIYDLYCGTGTISLLVAPAASKVIGVEIVEEAVRAARANAVRNDVTNCEFIAGDVLKVLDEIEEKPDLIILDPPRDGVHPKALQKILRYGVPYILYISCKPTSLARDLPSMRGAGYEPIRGVTINQFPKTANSETLVLMSNE